MFSKLSFTIVLLCLFSSIPNVSGQTTAELLAFDFATETYETLSTSRYDESIKRDHTDHNCGDKTIASMENKAPTSNLIDKTGFTNLIPIVEMQKEMAFPYTTGVKVILPGEGDKHQATGVMVGERHVLTTAHSVLRKYTNDPLFDQIDVIASYDFNLSKEELRSSVTKMYFVNNWSIFDGEDLVLLELADPVGLISGWMSIGYETSEHRLKDAVYHKISYPAYNTPYNSKPYTGDDLHYSYGVADYVSQEFIGVQDHLIGLGGESGSPIFKTKGKDEFITYGVLTYLGNYNHSRIKPSVYYKFKEILVGEGSKMPVKSDVLNKFEVYKIAKKRVLISWDVDDKEMFSSYKIERSSDGEVFTPLSVVEANEATSQGYTFLDEDPLNGKVYYRLNGIDLAEEVNVLDVLPIEIKEASKFDVNIYPNPTTDFINIEPNKEIDKPTSLRIFSSNGLLIEEKNFETAQRLSTLSYEKGIYFIVLQSGTAKESFSFNVL